MTTALYPTTVDPLIGYSVEPVYYTQKTPTKSGADVAEKLWDTPRFRIKLPYRVSATDAATLLNFHHARRGSYEAFDFIDLYSRAWVDVYVGTGTGSTATWDIPFAGPSGLVVYVDGSSKTSGVDYNYFSAGENGRGQVTFLAGRYPGAGEIITIDATGYRYFYARFENDNLPYRTLPQFSGGAEMVDLEVRLISQRT